MFRRFSQIKIFSSFALRQNDGKHAFSQYIQALLSQHLTRLEARATPGVKAPPTLSSCLPPALITTICVLLLHLLPEKQLYALPFARILGSPIFSSCGILSARHNTHARPVLLRAMQRTSRWIYVSNQVYASPAHETISTYRSAYPATRARSSISRAPSL